MSLTSRIDVHPFNSLCSIISEDRGSQISLFVARICTLGRAFRKSTVSFLFACYLIKYTGSRRKQEEPMIDAVHFA